MSAWPVARIDGRRGFKLMPGRFPPIRHFQRIAGAGDLEVLDAVAAMTDEHARDEIGRIELVPAHERYRGSNVDNVMSAFTVFDPAGSLFSDGSCGVCYLRMLEPDAILQAERRFADFLAATAEGPIKLRLGLYSFTLLGEAADLRDITSAPAEFRADDGGAATRELGRRLRAAGVAAALYSDPALAGAETLAVFKPGAIKSCARSALVELDWNGHALESPTATPSVDGVRQLHDFKWRTRNH